MQHEGRRIDAVAQFTKHGYLFLFNRDTGEPVFPVVEVAAPSSSVPGEKTAATQPFPLLPPPLARRGFHKDWISTLSPDNTAELRARIAGMRMGHLFMPPSTEGTVQ